TALIEDVTRQAPASVVAVLSAGDLESLTGFSEDVRQETAEALRAARGSNLLVVEDLQHLTGRGAEALVGLLDYVLPRGTRVVLTALVGPGHLELPARLTSRLAGGLVVGLEALQAPSRLTLLRDLAARKRLSLTPEVLAWLAEHLTGGGRQLEGAFHRLQTVSRLHVLSPSPLVGEGGGDAAVDTSPPHPHPPPPGGKGKTLDVATVAALFHEQA